MGITDWKVGPQNWWVGEFTSWPILKKRTRRAAATLRSAELLHTTLSVQRQPGAKNLTAAAVSTQAILPPQLALQSL